MSTYVEWSGVLVQEGTPTGDGREILRNALTWEGLPLPLRYVTQDIGGHDNSVVVGRIDTVTRDGLDIRGTGVIDTSTDDGARAAELIREGMSRGVSADLDDVDAEIIVTGPDGSELDPESEEYLDDDATWTMRVRSARLRAATLVAIPAFPGALLEITSESEEDPAGGDPALVASAIPVAPPAAWFADPRLTGPTALTITDDGRVYGHLATFDVCHIGIEGVCTTAPRSATGYSYYRTGAVVCDDGTTVATGAITMDTGHAGRALGAAATAAHYDTTGTAVADVTAGEDAYGIWVAGALRPGTTPEQVRALRGSALSGDWRTIAGSLELVAALAVNVPGFPIPRPALLVASGETRAMVAAGVVTRTGPKADKLAGLSRVLKREQLAGRVRNGV